MVILRDEKREKIDCDFRICCDSVQSEREEIFEKLR